jgi:hypothetical protein
VKDYGISIETAEGVRTRQWLSYAGDEAATADWIDQANGRRIEISREGQVVGVIDDRPQASDAA